jgi:hypothetical protein
MLGALSCGFLPPFAAFAAVLRGAGFAALAIWNASHAPNCLFKSQVVSG